MQLGLLFGVLATVTGAIWARLEWGAFWNWDPRQGSIVLALLFYAAYLALRAAVEDHETRRRLAAGYAVLGLVVAPFLFFVAAAAGQLLAPPRAGDQRARRGGRWTRRSSSCSSPAPSAFTVLFYWLLDLQRRIVAARRRREAARRRRHTDLRETRIVGDISTSVRIGIVAVNLVIWTGLFLYLLRLGRKLRRLEEGAGAGGKTMKRNRLYLLGGVLLVAFAGFSLSSFRQTLTPYVSFDQARSVTRPVQVAGALEKGSNSYDEATSSLVFTLRDPKSQETLRVRYHGLRPANFEDALVHRRHRHLRRRARRAGGGEAAGQVPEQVPGRRSQGIRLGAWHALVPPLPARGGGACGAAPRLRASPPCGATRWCCAATRPPARSPAAPTVSTPCRSS